MSTSSTSTRILRGFSRAGKLAELRLKRLYRRNRALRFAAMVADSLLWTAIIGVWIWMFYWAGQITSFCSFHVPTQSMTPTVLPGDYGIVNKWRLGARIFDIKKAVAGERVTIYRLPGYGRIEHGEIAVFNDPLAAPDSIGLNLRRYYCKRIIGLPGDTLSIVDGHYKVAGYDGPLCPISAEDNMGYLVRAMEKGAPKMVALKAWPYDSIVGWTVMDYGPLVIPARGTRIPIDRTTALVYGRYIEWERGDGKRPCWSEADSCVMIDGQPLTEYIFKENYYFAAGDRVENSADSRYWGIVPEPMIVGVAWRLWDSTDHSTGRRRHSRIGRHLGPLEASARL